MAIICISRELGTNGDEVARELSEITGYRFVEREKIDEELRKHEIGSDELRKYDERRPGLWSSTSERRAKFLHYLEKAICAEALAGNCILLGRGAGAILGGVPGVVSVRLVAPLFRRLTTLMSARGYDERRAEHEVRHSDHERGGFYRYFFQTDWRDPTLYDLSINTANLSPAQAASIIDAFRQLSATSDPEKDGIARLNAIMTRLQVVEEIVFNDGIRVDHLQVTLDGGKVTLQGSATVHEAKLAVEAAARVPEVTAVEDKLRLVPLSTAV